MGFDVYGKNPRNKQGEYFRASIWQWRPLWEYCEEIAPEVTRNVESPYTNDGYGLDAQDAESLAQAIDLSLLTATPTEKEAAFEKRLSEFPLVPCPFPANDGNHDECFVCDGSGEYRDIPFEKAASIRPFTVDLVKEFMTFCRNSGGFKIH